MKLHGTWEKFLAGLMTLIITMANPFTECAVVHLSDGEGGEVQLRVITPVMTTQSPKVCRIMAFWAIFRGLGPLFHLHLGSRHLLSPKNFQAENSVCGIMAQIAGKGFWWYRTFFLYKGCTSISRHLLYFLMSG